MDGESARAHSYGEAQEVQALMAAAIPPPVLEAYYAAWCAPCRRELPALAEFQREGDGALRIVIVGESARAHETLRGVSRSLADAAVLPLPGTARAVLRRAGDSDGMLPYARSLSSSGKLCAQWRGLLTIERARRLVGACAKLIAPRSQRS